MRLPALQLARLTRVRDQLASARLVNVEPSTVTALDDALTELDDAIAHEAKLAAYTDTMSESFDCVAFTRDFFGVQPMVEMES